MDKEFSGRILVPILIMLIYVAALWFVLLPPWKRQMYQTMLLQMADRNRQRATGGLLTVRDELELVRFRNLISRYDHEQVAARDKRQKGNQS